MRRILAALFAGVLAATALVARPAPAGANGWEHGAVPFEALLRALGFEQPETRRRAAESLGFRGQREAVEPLLGRLAAPEESAHVRSAIYVALGRLGDRRASPALVRCLEAEAREEVRADCALALGMLADPATVPRLLGALDGDASFLVRSRALDALGSFRTPQAVAALARLARGERGAQLRLRALRALGRTGAPGAAAPLLAALAGAQSGDERATIVEALAALRPAAAREPLTALLETTDDPALRARITIALGAIREGEAAPTLLRLLADPSAVVRYHAVEGLRVLARPETAAAVARLSLDLSRRLAARSVAALLEDLPAVLDDLVLQEAAVRALGALDPPRALDALLAAAAPRPIAPDSAEALRLAEGVFEVRRTALVALGSTGAPRAAAFLVGPGGLGDPDPRLRAAAVRSLGVLGFADAAGHVARGLGDAAAEVRWTAAAVLGRLGQRLAVEPLLRRLDDPHAEVRRQAALSLGYLGDPRARPALARLAHADERAAVREAAAYALRLLER